MVWSITASNVGVDVDLLFEENSTIGQRIKLAENIVTSLVRMQSPHPLQSHQIQGLDYDHILPALRWLVRKVIETRSLTGDEVRSQSVAAFSRTYTLPEDVRSSAALSYVSNASSSYKSQRKFKKREGAVFDSDLGRVEATLLEYDEKLIGVAPTVDEEQEERRRERVAEGKVKAGETEDAEVRVQRQLQEDKARIESLQGQLSASANASQDKVSSTLVGKILSMRADSIAQAETAYEDSIAKAGASALSAKDVKKAEEQRHRRQTDALRRRADESLATAQARLGPMEEAQERVQQATNSLSAVQAAIARIQEETEAVIAEENSTENKEVLARLKNLVGVVEGLKKSETQFKQMCRSEHKRLSDLSTSLATAESAAEDAREEEIDRLMASDKDKLAKLRQLIALRNQEIARAERAIGEIPTRAELLQFERRFVELYELVAEKLIESRKYFDMYNRLNTMFKYMQSELSILESIITNFPVGMRSTTSRAQMIEQFDKMLQGVRMSREQVDKQYEGVHEKELKLIVKHDKLLEKQRTYFKIVKDFQEECTINEKLTSTLQAIQNEADQ